MNLETERLRLRSWQKSDEADLVEGLNNMEVARWLAFVPHPYTDEDAKRWIEFCASIEESDSQHEFAVELKSEQKVIGGLSLSRINKTHGTAGGGIWLNSQYQGSGFGREAFGEKIRFAFEDLQLRRLENGFFVGNEASLRMQERFGFVVEGKKRKAYKCMADGELKDECITGLLEEDWIKE